MKLEGRKIAILVEDLYNMPEFWYPYYRLKEEGAEVHVVGPERKTYKSKEGYPATADLTAKEASEQDFDAVIIPGGYAPDRMRRTPEMVEFVRKMNEKGRLIAAICHGPWILVSAGAAKGRRMTSFFSIKDDLVNAGAEYVDAEVVADGNVITSRKPDDLPAYLRAIIKKLSEM